MDQAQGTNENNCFVPGNGDGCAEFPDQNERFLYDEAELLLYECSETSFPAFLSETQLQEVHSTESEWETSSVKTTYCSVREQNLKATPYYSAESSLRETAAQCVQPASESKSHGPGSSPPNERTSGRVTAFEKAIIEKFKEISNSSLVSEGKTGLEELYVRKTPFFGSSSDSDPQTNHREEDVFSTGVSDCDVVRSEYKNYDMPDKEGIVKTKSIVIRHRSKPKVSVLQSSQILPTSEKFRFQSRSPMRAANPSRAPQPQPNVNHSAKPCHLFVEEIRKNNLIMKEDIFSSSKVKNNESVASFETENSKKLDVNPKIASAHTRVSSPWRRGGMNNGVEVYETKGEERKSTDNMRVYEEEVRTKGNMIRGREAKKDQRKVTTNPTNKQIQTVSHGQVDFADKDKAQQSPKFVDVGVSPYEETNYPAGYLLETCADKPPNKILSKYVKLPGFPEAFKTHDCAVKELRIKDGTSFESINALNVLSPADLPSCREILHDDFRRNFALERSHTLGCNEGLCPKIIETKDAGTYFEVLNRNVVTQTEKSEASTVQRDINVLSTADTSVQCDSQITSTKTESSNHKEIMVCDDDGNGVQLYNVLGHPLTDVDGYLLKDSLGRFLVRLDQFGVPVSCTKGEEIFLENGSEWNSLKSGLNVIHQGSKRNILKRAKERRTKVRHKNAAVSLKQFSNAMKNLTSTVEWADQFSFDVPVSGQQTESEESSMPLKNQTASPIMSNNVVENSSTLVAEMRSMAKLRNALLEKVNFIAGHRKPLNNTVMNGSKSAYDTEEATCSQRAIKNAKSFQPSVLRSLSNESPTDLRHNSVAHNTTTVLTEDKANPYSWKNSALLSSYQKSNQDRGTDKGLVVKSLQEPKKNQIEKNMDWDPPFQLPQVNVNRYNFSSKMQDIRMQDRTKRTGYITNSLLGKWGDSKPTIESSSNTSLITNI